MGKAGKDSGLEKAEPFTDPVIDGKGVRGYGAYAFRKEDQAFVDAFNAELAKFLGTEEHKTGRALRLHGRGAAQGHAAAKLCAGQ